MIIIAGNISQERFGFRQASVVALTEWKKSYIAALSLSITIASDHVCDLIPSFTRSIIFL